MTCQDFQEHLSAYVDRELSEPDALLMAAHAETCARCQKKRAFVVEMKSLLRDKSMPGIPADLVASIEAETLLNPHWWESENFRTRWLPALVGVATAVGALWLSKSHENPRPQAVIPIAARPQKQPAPSHAFLPHTETSESQKGESSEKTKS